jgi:drug/metabolite transporter (DMT)-like permease
MHPSDTSSRSGAGPTLGGRGAVGILIASVAVFFLIVLLFGVSWYAWGLLGVIIVCVGIYSIARFGINRAGGTDGQGRS